MHDLAMLIDLVHLKVSVPTIMHEEGPEWEQPMGVNGAFGAW